MSLERVDKNWRKQGLDKYSTAAILGTLGHYGVGLDEAGFAQLARERYPLAIAEQWQATWRGTGQFSEFPPFAADELWRRVEKGRVAPSDLAQAVAKLLFALEKMREGSPEAPVGEAFQQVEELKARLGAPSDAFLEEVHFHLTEWNEILDQLAQKLARDGHVEDAADFAAVEELIFPEREGTSRALVRALRGEKEQALSELVAIASSADRSRENRLWAVDTLIELEAHEEAERQALPLFELAERERDFHLALHLGQRLEHLLEKLPPSEERDRLTVRLAELALAHQREHQH